MAFDIIDTSYSGTYTPYFITRATYGMDTIRKNLVYVSEGIKKQRTIARLDYNNPLRPNEATPVAVGGSPFELDGRLLVPKNASVYEEFNPRDLESNQLAEQLSATILDREVPAGFQSQLVQVVLNRSAEQYENGVWMGSLAYAGVVPSTDPRYQLQYFNGFLQRMVNDPLVNLSSISPVTITTSNIAAILDDLITQCTTKAKALISDPEAFKRLKFIMSPATGSIYGQYLRTGATFKGNSFNTGYIPPWGGYAVEIAAGMADDTILFCRATDEPLVSNLYLGMNSMSDWEVKCMRVQNNSELFFIQAKWKWDCNYGWSEELFLYTTLTTADFLP